MNTQNIIKVVRWDLVTHKKSYINGWLAIAGLTALLGLILGLSNGRNYAIDLGNTMGAMFTIIWLVLFTGLSNILHTKTQRIAFLMLPASMTEKLVSRKWVYLVIYPIGLIGCLAVGDAVQYLINLILHGSEGAHFAFPYFIGYLVSPIFSVGHFSIHFGNLDYVNTITNLLTLLFFLSYGFLCGCIWTKHALLKGIGTFTVGMILFAALMAFLGYLITGSTEFELTVEDGSTIVRIIGIVFSIISLVLSAFFIWLGHRKFVNRQVIDTKNKWYEF